MTDINFDALLASATDHVELKAPEGLPFEDYDPNRVYVYLIRGKLLLLLRKYGNAYYVGIAASSFGGNWVTHDKSFPAGYHFPKADTLWYLGLEPAEVNWMLPNSSPEAKELYGRASIAIKSGGSIVKMLTDRFNHFGNTHMTVFRVNKLSEIMIGMIPTKDQEEIGEIGLGYSCHSYEASWGDASPCPLHI